MSKDSYSGLGGTSIAVEIDKLSHFNSTIRDKLITKLLANVEIEFISVNMEFNFVSFVVIYVDCEFGGTFPITYNTYLFKINPLSDIFDYIRIFCEFMFLIIFFYYFYRVTIKIIEQNREYYKWEKEQIAMFNELIIKFRNRVKPEFLRKWEYIFDLTKLNDIIFLFISIYFIYLKIYVYYLQITLNRNFSMEKKFDNYSIFSLRNTIFQQGQVRENLDLTGSIMVILSSFLFITNFNNGQQFAILTSTIMESKTNNFIFIIIIFLIQPAFIFFGYLSFGYATVDFSTIAQSLINCFILFFSIIILILRKFQL